MGQTITIRPKRWRVFLEDDGTVKQVPREGPEPDGTVFELVPVPLDAIARVSGAPKGSQITESIIQMARRCIVGWAGLQDQDGGLVPFDVSLIESGILPSDIALALLTFVTEQMQGSARGKANSAPTPEMKLSGGEDTEASGTASPVM